MPAITRSSRISTSSILERAGFYLEVNFAAAARSIQTHFARSDWSNYTEIGDYSFDPTKTSFADWARVTPYRNGVLVWDAWP